MSSEDVQILDFLENDMFFFEKKHLKDFKNTKHGYFPLECLSEVITAYAIFKRSKSDLFRKKNVFLRKNLWKTSGALVVIFNREWLSDIHIASEGSKQSNLWVFRRNKCCFWKDPFFPKSVNVAFFFYFAFQIV